MVITGALVRQQNEEFVPLQFWNLFKDLYTTSSILPVEGFGLTNY